MALTEKQTALRDYLLQRLGFKGDDYLEHYTEQLSKIASIYRNLAALPENELDKEKQLPYYSQTYFINTNGIHEETGFFVPKYFGIVDVLMLEYKYKSNNSFKGIENSSNYLSATDLANYIFCPIGYSISKSYEQIENARAKQGTDLHEQKLLDIESRRLFEEKKSRGIDGTERKIPNYLNASNKYFFDDIATSDLIYSGHTKDEEIKYFINEEKAFTGQPDYIFKNAEGHFYVVEEKFKVLKEEKQNYFAESHRVQLATYIHYLKEYDIKYGYLTYWIYKLDSKGYTWLDACYILKISRETKIEIFLDELIFKIKDFTIKKYLDVDINKLNPKKCANCVHMMICGHKNKRHSQVTIPYNKTYFKLFYASYPEILKKGVKPAQNYIKDVMPLPKSDSPS